MKDFFIETESRPMLQGREIFINKDVYIKSIRTKNESLLR